MYQSQTTNPVVYASLGLAALFGWTAAILMVGGSGEKKHAKPHGVKEGEPTSLAGAPFVKAIETRGAWSSVSAVLLVQERPRVSALSERPSPAAAY